MNLLAVDPSLLCFCGRNPRVDDCRNIVTAVTLWSDVGLASPGWSELALLSSLDSWSHAARVPAVGRCLRRAGEQLAHGDKAVEGAIAAVVQPKSCRATTEQLQNCTQFAFGSET